MVEPGRRDLHQAPGQLGHAGMGRAEQRGVREPVELVGHRRVDLGHAVPEQVAPQGGGAVEEPPAAIVDQVVAFGPTTTSGSLARYSGIWVNGCQTWSASQRRMSSARGHRVRRGRTAIFTCLRKLAPDPFPEEAATSRAKRRRSASATG